MAKPDPEAQVSISAGAMAGVVVLSGIRWFHENIWPTPFGIPPEVIVLAIFFVTAIYWAVKAAAAEEEAARKATEDWLQTHDGKNALREIDERAEAWQREHRGRDG